MFPCGHRRVRLEPQSHVPRHGRDPARFSTIPGYALIPLFCVYITEFQIKPEERALLASVGSEYEAYLAKVRRWV